MEGMSASVVLRWSWRGEGALRASGWEERRDERGGAGRRIVLLGCGVEVMVLVEMSMVDERGADVMDSCDVRVSERIRIDLMMCRCFRLMD